MTNAPFPPNPTLDELRQEFIGNDVRGWIWNWLAAVSDAYIRLRLKGRYREAVYSPSGAWDDEGIGDLVTDFIMERVIDKGLLSRALRLAENIEGLQRYLERSLHNYVVSERVKSVTSNIYDRLVNALSEDPALRRLSGVGGRTVYGLTEWGDAPAQVLAADRIAEGMRYFPSSINWREYHTGERQSPGLLNEDLLAIAHAVMAGTRCGVTPSIIMRLVRQRFDLTAEGPAASITLDKSVGEVGRRPSPLDEAVADDLARRIVGILKPEERAVLAAMTEEFPMPTVRQIADKLAISKSLVSRRQQRIQATFRALHVPSGDEQGQVLGAAIRYLTN